MLEAEGNVIQAAGPRPLPRLQPHLPEPHRLRPRARPMAMRRRPQLTPSSPSALVVRLSNENNTCPNAKGNWGSTTVDFTNCAMLALVMAAAVLVSDGGQRFCEMEPAQRAALLASAQVILAFGGRPPSRHRYHDWPCVVGDTGRYANRMRKRLWR